MAKYYVQCGSDEWVLTSDCPESAAVAVMDSILAPHVWIYDDPKLSEMECRQHLMLEALLHLPTELRVSERGFHREDADRIPVPETIDTWHKLIVAMQRWFARTGLRRPIAVLAGASRPSGSDVSSCHPKRPR